MCSTLHIQLFTSSCPELEIHTNLLPSSHSFGTHFLSRSSVTSRQTRPSHSCCITEKRLCRTRPASHAAASHRPTTTTSSIAAGRKMLCMLTYFLSCLSCSEAPGSCIRRLPQIQASTTKPTCSPHFLFKQLPPPPPLPPPSPPPESQPGRRRQHHGGHGILRQRDALSEAQGAQHDNGPPEHHAG